MLVIERTYLCMAVESVPARVNAHGYSVLNSKHGLESAVSASGSTWMMPVARTIPAAIRQYAP